MSCGTMCCIPLLVPLFGSQVASSALNFFPFDIPFASQVITVGIIIVATYVVAKLSNWNSTQPIFWKSLVPSLVFIVWLGLFFFPLTSPIMLTLGSSIFVLLALSLLYNVIYDAMFP